MQSPQIDEQRHVFEGSRTEPPAPVEGLPRLWDALAEASHAALFLDYDGTLAPFHVDRMAAKPLEGVIETLLQIVASAHTHLFIVSGRPTHEIMHLAGDLGLTIVGGHGWEWHRPGVGLTRAKVSAEQERLLSAAHAFAIGLLGAQRVERKVASVAAHLRALPAHEAAAVREALSAHWLAEVGDGAVELRSFDDGLELRALGRHKGIAVTDLLADLPVDTLAVYLGDDETDEDAFSALRGFGFGIRVGDPERPSAATGKLRSCADVPRFLLDWANVRAAMSRQT
jgi:trehalose 6-phosphate phosphatase